MGHIDAVILLVLMALLVLRALLAADPIGARADGLISTAGLTRAVDLVSTTGPDGADGPTASFGSASSLSISTSTF